MLIGTSLKMYFSHARTVEWVTEAARLAGRHPAVADGRVVPFVIPQFPSIPAAVEIGGPAGLRVGAQDVAAEDAGAFTGEVSAAVLAELGCRYAEVGHAERRRLFGETEEIVAAKVDAALRNGLTPLLCLGELERGEPAAAVAECVRQLDSALGVARSAGRGGDIVIAYEPVWAIGAARPAGPDHIRGVCGPLREHARARVSPSARVIYGGSAGPGLLEAIGDSVDGLFLGRFAHDPASFGSVLDEAAALTRPGA
ncbi:triosephosphate isomerase [Leucobacter sp. CSA1]|uniref:Triosephosphate isomerase n=2 Tax=Leucobacter chromiisoli TaxID=2796471 RepID=A0A934Q5M3_9MICO|nr:triosephosphate isomerase [Leucobacter chromiisoli]